jgi:hypothetical protein
MSRISVILTSRFLLNLRENMDANIVYNEADVCQTVDVLMSDIILQQMGEPQVEGSHEYQ